MTRIITPGTLTDAALLEEKSESLLLALCVHESTLGLAWLNLAAGQFCVTETPLDNLMSELERLKPAEILLPESVGDCRTANSIDARKQINIKRLPAWQFDVEAAVRNLSRQFGTHDLSGFGCDGLHSSLGAASALLDYARLTQGANEVSPISRRSGGAGQRLPAHGCRHPPQPGNFRNHTWQCLAHFAVPAGYLFDQHGQPPAASLAASSTARPGSDSEAARWRIVFNG